MTGTPQMLNWLCRYALATPIALDEHRELRTSLLDAGSGPHGFACATDSPFVGMDMTFPLPAAPSMLAVRNGPGPLPFADASFGTVVSLDVLEHVPPRDRSAFVAELARVSAGRLVVACPSSEMGPVDDLVREMFVRSGQAVPGWLSEHDEFGLPTPEEVREHCTPPEGFSCRPLAVPNGLLSTMASLADFVPEMSAQGEREATTNGRRWVELFEAATFGGSWRKAYLLERLDPGAPLVELANLRPTAIAALRCPTCRASFDCLGPALLRCEGCGAVRARDAMGAWDVRPGVTSLWCEPGWDPDGLAPLLHGFADLEPPGVSLELVAPPETVSGEAALACAAAALGGRELPEHVDVAIVRDRRRPAASATVIDPSTFRLFSPAGRRAP